MKLIFATVSVAALMASMPVHAASVISAGLKPGQECAIAAGKQDLTSRQMANALSACDAALTGDLSQQGRAGVLVNRGILRAAAGRSEAAIADFNDAVARDPSLSAAYMNRGVSYLKAGRYKEARADFDHAISLGTGDLHVAYFNRGEAQEASGDLVAAYHDYRKAQELAPGFKPAGLELARFQVTKRRVADGN